MASLKSLHIPRPPIDFSSTAAAEPTTPKTPADEGIEFFEFASVDDKSPIRIYELPLDPDGGPNKERTYVRLPPATTPYVLRVTIDAGTPASKNGVFKTNFPLDGGAFSRDRFTERKLPIDFSKPIKVDLPISCAGAFMYWVEFDGVVPDTRTKGREGYFNVDPILLVKPRVPILLPDLTINSKRDLESEYVNLPLDGISMITLVSKWMGPVSGWRNHFQEAKDRGYNMIHWTPIQERGESDSPYSIRNQLAYDPSMFEDKSDFEKDGGVSKIEEIIRVAREDYGLLSLTDVVLNHTSNDCPWLREHPEAGYSPVNSPHLTSALDLDTAILNFSNSLTKRGLPIQVTSTDDVETLTHALTEYLKSLDFWQYYVLDVKAEREKITEALSTGKITPWDGPNVAGKTTVEHFKILKDSGKIDGYRGLTGRFSTKVDGSVAAGFVKAAFPEVSSIDALADGWIEVVDVVNVSLYEEWGEDTKVALENIKNRLKYTRLDDHGPKLGPISEKSPLVEPYFTRLPEAKADPLKYSLANNGWIWNANPLENFASPPSKAYLRREVIVWNDCVKLRYGSGPEDNPWLWDYILKYATTLASTFQGFRIDNCHSTPLHVGVRVLDAARVANPNLYVCAELFTGNEETDLLFVRRLGLNSLVREAGNAWDPKEFSRLLYRHGVGKPLGSMGEACLTVNEELSPPTGKGPSRPAVVIPHNGSAPHALFYDLTHDNESYLHKRSAEDALSTGALVTFSWSAIASVKGFDDLYPALLDLVNEKRHYEITGLAENSGIARAKMLLNSLHAEMAIQGFEEGHVHQENDYIVLHRVQPATQKGYILVAHTAFTKGSKDRGYIDPIKLRSTRVKYVTGYTIDISAYETAKDETTLRGLPGKITEIPTIIAPRGTDTEGPYSEIIVPEYFPPGSFMLFETHLEGLDPGLDQLCASGAEQAFRDLNLVELNVVLFRCEGEERDATKGKIGAYDLPGTGKLVYCGLEGWMHPLRHIIRYNDLGHSLCANLRQGTWAFDYISGRLSKQTDTFPRLEKPAAWFKERFDKVKATVPPFLRPKYFAIIISEAYKAVRRIAIEQCSEFVVDGHSFTHDLALCSLQMHGQVASASLDPGKITPSLAAGLPHFAGSWARCWGRDVFISLRGLFLTTGNFEGARRHILAFASTLKHGLIPNLLDSVRNPRYNSRDSPWWMLQNIQDYCVMAPDGYSILNESVKRRFPKDDTWVPWDDPKAYAFSGTIAEIIQEILQRHAEGISFREHNAGPNLDMQMKDEGFQIDVKVDWNTGFTLGGSEYNCGTWMDKMGESAKAGTKGVPGTPRDGAPVEIIGLLFSTLRWLSELSDKGKFPFKGVDATIDGVQRLVTYKEWAELIHKSFERCFYIPLDPSKDPEYKLSTGLINRRGIYKDVFGSGPGREWSDYQFRPNFPIAMVVAPELFNPVHALGALRLADQHLRGPLGMKTLDAADLQYRPQYDNSNDSDDPAIAKGRNYHQGPEWGWPLGYFLRAYLYFDTKVGQGNTDPTKTLHKLHEALLPSRHHIQNDPWAGLPELTNDNGGYCSDSCNTQAWSSSTLLDFLEDVHKFSS